MDRFKEKAILLALVQGNIDYNKYKGDNYCVKVTKIEYMREHDKSIIKIYFLNNGIRCASRFGFIRESYESYGEILLREMLDFEVFNFIDDRSQGIMGLFIKNYLYFSIETPTIIYAYGYKCKDVVKLICKKMLKLLLIQVLSIRFMKCREMWDEYVTKINNEETRNNREEKQMILISFVKDVFDMLQFEKSFEFSIEN